MASKHGVPRGSLADAEGLAKILWDAARIGSVTEAAMASPGKASGGSWRKKMALMRAFGLMDSDADSKIRLSPIGRKIVQTHDAVIQLEGRREAVSQVTSYANVLRNSEGENLPTPASLAGTFEHTYGLSNADAKQAATDFVASVTLAELLDDEARVRLDGASLVTDAEDATDDADGATGETAPPAQQPPAPNTPTPPAPPAPPAPPVVIPGNGKVDVSVTLDLSQFAVDDVLRVLTALGVVVDD